MHECFFYEKDKIIYAMCVECKDEKFPSENFYYYDGDFGHKSDVICEECKKIIRKFEEEV